MAKNIQSPLNESPYYMHTGKMPLASKLSWHVRRKMFSLFMGAMRPTEENSILDFGVTSDNRYQESNYFERLYPHKDKVVCAGTEDGNHLEQKYPGVTFVLVKAKQPLPFVNQQFDIVFSNAVVEHTGGEGGQQFFVKEILRVGKAFFITTPNRWFPIEMHTGLPLLQYLPMPIYRFVLGRIGFQYWASEENLNLLDVRSFSRLFPSCVSVKVVTVKVAGIPSNLIAYGGKGSCE
jgi:SAM-dependent methyltransferase